MRKLPKNTKSQKFDLVIIEFISSRPLKPLKKKITLTELREMLRYKGKSDV
ncbi:hypothetical protein H4J57_09260 [Colwellia sp. BRX8-7]|uniref:hypothetical protein n=1 Tax=Colwellia sp. BRX8-7 TaxID=2759833 RepID=UPI0015F76FEB|nr:hypothetical protein [Colwellia sp. BRX8-7]MBA6337388.1 hypothetical protein [Colwellia sp. BRX8-7]